jgi:hypothetical protein
MKRIEGKIVPCVDIRVWLKVIAETHKFGVVRCKQRSGHKNDENDRVFITHLVSVAVAVHVSSYSLFEPLLETFAIIIIPHPLNSAGAVRP